MSYPSPAHCVFSDRKKSVRGEILVFAKWSCHDYLFGYGEQKLLSYGIICPVHTTKHQCESAEFEPKPFVVNTLEMFLHLWRYILFSAQLELKLVVNVYCPYRNSFYQIFSNQALNWQFLESLLFFSVLKLLQNIFRLYKFIAESYLIL